jgi:hypothetical protein
MAAECRLPEDVGEAFAHAQAFFGLMAGDVPK